MPESQTPEDSKSTNLKSLRDVRLWVLKVFRVSLSERLRVLRISDSRFDSKTTLITLYTYATFVEDGHQDDGLESSKHTITMPRNFRFSGSLYIGLSLQLCVVIIGFAGRRGRNARVKIPRPSVCDVPHLWWGATLCLQYHYYHVIVAEATCCMWIRKDMAIVE